MKFILKKKFIKFGILLVVFIVIITTNSNKHITISGLEQNISKEEVPSPYKADKVVTISNENQIAEEKDKEKVAEEKEMIEFAKNNLIKDIFGKKKIVFTGDMSKSRAEMRAMAIRYGADSPTSISGKTNMLVIGEEAGKSKLEKAKQLGIEIITEQEFWEIINKEAGETKDVNF